MKALRIDTCGHTTELDLATGDDGATIGLRSALGAATIEALDITRRCTAWIDENGIAAHRRLNPAASALASQLGRRYLTLRGTVVLTGSTDPDGNTTGLTTTQIDDIQRRLRDTLTI